MPRTTEVKASPCPTCRRIEEMATDPTGQARPKVGDVAICFHCQAINRYADDMTLRAITAGELAELRESSTWPIVQRYIRAARTARRHYPPPAN